MSRPLANWTTLWRAIDWLGEATTIKPERVKPILSLSLFHSDQKCVEGEPYTSPEVSPTPNIHLVLFGRRVIDTTKWEQGPEGLDVEGGGGKLTSRIKVLLYAMPDFLTHGDSLYFNAPVFIRISFPFFVGIQVRWSGSKTSKAFLQSHVGWKSNGRLALALRVQSDPSAEAGMDFPNPGQGKSWEYAGK